MTEEPRKVVLESGIEVKPAYSADDRRGADEERVGLPGRFPFTRGIHPLMYRKRPFTMRQYSGFGTPEETNRRFRFLLGQGQDALNVAFDLPTQLGLDSDDPRAEGEVGRVGMAVDSLKDFETAFDGIPLDKVSTSLTINAPAPVLMAMHFIVAEAQGVKLSSLRGTAQNDILKEYIGRGAWVFPVKPSLRLIGDTMEFCARNAPRYYPVSVCGYHIRESGATPVQEMAYALAIAMAYVDIGVSRGLKVDEFASRISFNFDIFGNFFEQIAKFRAGRRLWATLMRDRCGARDEETMKLKMIAGGGGGGYAMEEPENNIVRAAYYALVSALSGTQTMALCSYDEAYTIPTEHSALISLRTMQILVEEIGVCDTADPLGGSYYVESLTDGMEERIRGEMKALEEAGGIVRCVESGAIQRRLARQAYENERALQEGRLVKVGVNKYRTEAGEARREVRLHQVDEASVARQVERLRRLRSERDNARVSAGLAELGKAAGTDGNLMGPIMEAVRAYATVGEITGVLKDAFGEFREPTIF